jgi:hypothetical protein
MHKDGLPNAQLKFMHKVDDKCIMNVESELPKTVKCILLYNSEPRTINKNPYANIPRWGPKIEQQVYLQHLQI